MILSKSMFFVIAALTTASYGTASAASITSCTISHYGTNPILAQDSGQTSCAAYVDPVPKPYNFRLESRAAWYQTSSLSFGASARSVVGNDCCGFLARVDSVAEGWTREDFYFTDAPIGSILRIDWSLLAIGPDSSEHLFSFAGEKKNDSFANNRTELPIVQGGPVIVAAYLRQGCYNNSFCDGETRFYLRGLDLVDALGVSQTGYRFGFGSGLRLRSATPDPVFSGGIFPGGLLDQSVPEPSTFLLTGGVLVVAALAKVKNKCIARNICKR